MSQFSPTIHPWNQELWQSLSAEPERVNHALLFCGNQGLGKQSLSIALAHFLMCDNHSQSEALFNAASHPDLHVLMPEVLAQDYLQKDEIIANFAQRYLESHSGKPRQVINIEQIRKLSLALTTHPHLSAIRVILILSADSMNANAANALLKNLEEPPENTLFILVTDELASLPKTIRSRCGLVNFRAPDANSSRAWLEQQNQMPSDLIDTHLAMANNHPLQALALYKSGYVDVLKAIFTDVNGLWSNKLDPVQAAKNWQKVGSSVVIDVLQKLNTDLIRTYLGGVDQLPSKTVFFPVQQSWIKSVSAKLSKDRLVGMVDELIYAKNMLKTTVDELLILETISNKFRQLPE